MGAASCQSVPLPVGAAAPILQGRACPVEVLGVPEVQEGEEPQALASPQVAAEDWPSVDRHCVPFGAGVLAAVWEGLAAPAASGRAYYRSEP